MTNMINYRGHFLRILEFCYILQIRRPYFHVKPLEKSQLKNWKEYLDFEIENGSFERILVLFERCMIACALYEDMWLKVRMPIDLINTSLSNNFAYT